MWGYQSHYRLTVELLAKQVFEKLGSDIEPKFFLVGMLRPGGEQKHLVCIEPENGEWNVSLFEGLEGDVKKSIPDHPLQNVFYGDEPSNRDIPIRILRQTISSEVKKRLREHEEEHDSRCFCSEAYPVGDYDVVCVLQIPSYAFESYPSDNYQRNDEIVESSLILSCINRILEESRRGLSQSEPGRNLLDGGIRTASEIIRNSASHFMRRPFLDGRLCTSDLFEHVNLVSQLHYEGATGVGRMIFSANADAEISYVLRLASPVELSQSRWARKLLQMATGDIALIANYDKILGLGRVSKAYVSPYTIDFLGSYQWDFRRGDQVLLRCRFGEVFLSQEPIDKNRFSDNLSHIFNSINDRDIDKYFEVLRHMGTLDHGSSLIIATDAAEEAKRLENQGTLIIPVALDRDLLERGTAIDGSILADPQGICHAIGVILDGPAVGDSLPSRGSRYNSAVRYVAAGSSPRMAFIVSEDRTLDVIPLLRPRIDRQLIEEAVRAIDGATHYNYHKPRAFLDEHRFYLNEEQCQVVNAALDRIESEPREVGGIILITQRFHPNPDMEPNYLKQNTKACS